jgi:hypothetical protein
MRGVLQGRDVQMVLINKIKREMEKGRGAWHNRHSIGAMHIWLKK